MGIKAFLFLSTATAGLAVAVYYAVTLTQQNYQIKLQAKERLVRKLQSLENREQNKFKTPVDLLQAAGSDLIPHQLKCKCVENPGLEFVGYKTMLTVQGFLGIDPSTPYKAGRHYGGLKCFTCNPTEVYASDRQLLSISFKGVTSESFFLTNVLPLLERWNEFILQHPEGNYCILNVGEYQSLHYDINTIMSPKIFLVDTTVPIEALAPMENSVYSIFWYHSFGFIEHGIELARWLALNTSTEGYYFTFATPSLGVSYEKEGFERLHHHKVKQLSIQEKVFFPLYCNSTFIASGLALLREDLLMSYALSFWYTGGIVAFARMEQLNVLLKDLWLPLVVYNPSVNANSHPSKITLGIYKQDYYLEEFSSVLYTRKFICDEILSQMYPSKEIKEHLESPRVYRVELRIKPRPETTRFEQFAKCECDAMPNQRTTIRIGEIGDTINVHPKDTHKSNLSEDGYRCFSCFPSSHQGVSSTILPYLTSWPTSRESFIQPFVDEVELLADIIRGKCYYVTGWSPGLHMHFERNHYYQGYVVLVNKEPDTFVLQGFDKKKDHIIHIPDVPGRSLATLRHMAAYILSGKGITATAVNCNIVIDPVCPIKPCQQPYITSAMPWVIGLAIGGNTTYFPAKREMPRALFSKAAIISDLYGLDENLVGLLGGIFLPDSHNKPVVNAVFTDDATDQGQYLRYASSKRGARVFTCKFTNTNSRLAYEAVCYQERIPPTFSGLVGKTRVVLIGPSGAGKTWYIDRFAEFTPQFGCYADEFSTRGKSTTYIKSFSFFNNFTQIIHIAGRDCNFSLEDGVHLIKHEAIIPSLLVRPFLVFSPANCASPFGKEMLEHYLGFSPQEILFTGDVEYFHSYLEVSGIDKLKWNNILIRGTCGLDPWLYHPWNNLNFDFGEELEYLTPEFLITLQTIPLIDTRLESVVEVLKEVIHEEFETLEQRVKKLEPIVELLEAANFSYTTQTIDKGLLIALEESLSLAIPSAQSVTRTLLTNTPE